MSLNGLTPYRARIYQFLATLYHDEVSEDLIDRMKSLSFIEGLEDFLSNCAISDLRTGVEKIHSFLKDKTTAETYQMLRYEYAEIFLNAGPNPAFPYESVYVSRDPLVMQQPVFEVRKAFRHAGVRKSENYPDLDDHLAVELEFVRYLLDKMAEAGEQAKRWQELQIDFLRRHLMSWVVEFCAVLSSSAHSLFYRGLSELTMSFLFHERILAFQFQAGMGPEEDLTDCLQGLARAMSVLDLGSAYLTLAEGVAEEKAERGVPTHCYICGALCGQLVKVRDGVITGIAGLPGDPKGGGRLCPKGATAAHHAYSAYRLKHPLVKEKGGFRKASWEEALDLVASNLLALDPPTVGYLRGNDWNNWLHEALFDAYGAHKTTHRSMCDNSNRMANEHNLNDKRPWIHYGESDYILMFGNNELATSYGQRKTAMFRKALERGAKLVVFDPRRSETAMVAAEWIPLKPATDGAVAMAMCYVIVKNELYQQDFVERWTYGFEDFKRRLLGHEDGKERTPQWAERISDVPAKTIQRLAMEFAHAEHPGAISWTGLSQNPNGMHATQAVQALNGLMGTFDGPGGPSLPFKRKLKSSWGEGQVKPPSRAPKEKLNRLGMWSGWAPAFFPKDVAEGRLKALVCYFGDPVLSWGNEEATIRAIEALQFKVSIDAFMSNTATLCDVVLPDSTYLEQSQLSADWLYDAFISYYQQAIEPLYLSRPSWWVFVELARRLGLGEYFPWKDIDDAHRNQLRGTPWSLEELKEKGFIITDPHEYCKYGAWQGMNPPEGYGSSGHTRTGKYNFKNPVAEEKGLDPLPDYVPPDEDLLPDETYPLTLVNFRILEHEHSSTFFNVSLMKLEGVNPLWINVLDARQRGIRHGDRIWVRSPWGVKETEAKVTWDTCQGVVASAGGFGHWRGPEGDPKYPQYGGTNTLGIIPPNRADEMGGTPFFKFVKVQVEKI